MKTEVENVGKTLFLPTYHVHHFWQGITFASTKNHYITTQANHFTKKPLSSIGGQWSNVIICNLSFNVVTLICSVQSCLCFASQVWFRKGLSRASDEETAVIGSRWVQMVGNFSLITIGLNDQVGNGYQWGACQCHV